MSIPFSKEQLSAPVPKLPLNDPRLDAPVYIEISIRKESIRWKPRHAQSPWTLRDCVPSTWINKHVHCIEQVTFIGIDRFGRVGLGMESAENETLDMWTSRIGLWRSSQYWQSKIYGREGNRLLGDFQFYAVGHWLRFDKITDEEKIAVLKRHIARHNQKIQRYQEFLIDPCMTASNKKWKRIGLTRERRRLGQAMDLLSGLGVPLDLSIVNAGKTGQLSLF